MKFYPFTYYTYIEHKIPQFVMDKILTKLTNCIYAIIFIFLTEK